MSVTPITPTRIVVDTETADILDADGTVATTPSDGWEIDLGATGKISQLLIRLVADGSGDTVVAVAGDRPPSEQSFRGNKSIVLAASDGRFFQPSGRFLQNDNKVILTCSDAGTKLYAWLMPKAFDGGTSVA